MQTPQVTSVFKNIFHRHFVGKFFCEVEESRVFYTDGRKYRKLKDGQACELGRTEVIKFEPNHPVILRRK